MRTHRFRLPLLLAAVLACAGPAGISQLRAEQSTISVRAAVALISPVAVNFDDVPLKDAVESLAAQADVRVIWDDEELAKMDLPGEETIAMQMERKVSFRSALCLILEPLHLSYETHGDTILITSHTKWALGVEKASYEVEDLLSGQFTEQTLTDLLSKEVAAGSWQRQDPDQQGYFQLEDGWLQVTHRREVQQELSFWLDFKRIEESKK